MTWDAFPDMSGIIKDFITEGVEGLDRLDLELISLENNPGDAGLLGSVLRTVHSIKGTSGVLGFLRVEALLHRGEDVLIAVREGQLELSSALTSTLLVMADLARELLAAIDAAGSEGDVDVQPVVAELSAFVAELEFDAASPAASPAAAEAPAVETTKLVAPERELEPAPEHQPASPSSDRSVRIDVDVLDRLMDQVGELVLARNRIQQLTSARQDAQLFAASQRLGVITSDLQEGVMKTRMQPITTLWNRLPRQIRDLSHSFGKEVRLVTSGEETELDRTVLEAFADPLTHLVRNCIDHGIETPSVRLAAGKPVEGVLQLRSFHQGGHVHIEVSDDGAGLQIDRIARRAVETGVLTEEQVRRMPERELQQFVFRPGFSTAEEVTSVSGRGVGLDVVKTNVERIGGSLEVHSQPGQGATFKLRIPLTLAIIPALMVACGGERYAIPQVSLLELVTLEPGDPNLQDIQGAPVYRLRDELLALVDLRLILGGTSPALRDRSDINIVVLQTDEEPFGLIVDEIQDTEEIVVKPLGDLLKGIAAYSGATVLGDGRVALILDVNGVASLSSISRLVEEATGALPTADAEEEGADTETLLLVRSQGNGRMAIPLSSVARLEEFRGADVERAGAVPVIQYRGTIIPLLYVTHLLESGDAHVSVELPERESLHAVVYQGLDFSAAVVVDEILDIVEAELTVQGPSTRRGVARTAVVLNRVTEIIDADWLLESSTRAVRGGAS